MAQLEIQSLMPIIGSAKTQFYRNRLDYTFSDRAWLTKEEMLNNETDEQAVLGFHAPGRFDKVLDIKKCWLQNDFSNKIRLTIKDIAIKQNSSFYNAYHKKGFLRNLVVRNTTSGEWMVLLIFGEEIKKERETFMHEVAMQLPEINSLLYIINEKKNDSFNDLEVHLFKGNEHITEQMQAYDSPEHKLRFKISAKSFYQTNSEQAYHLYKVAADFSALEGDQLVYDLYTGTGTIANFIAGKASRVIGIDYVADAIEDAKENSIANGISNTTFFAGDIKETFTNAFIAEHGKPDVVITDPPRAGMHQDVVKQLLEIMPERIVYVSCNPATQARDIKLMSNEYKIENLQPVDMFPHTSHVENVSLLIRNTNH